MKQTRMTRLQRLEGVDEAGRLMGLVVRLDLHGEPEIPLDELETDHPIIALPRKAASAEEWPAMVRQRWPQYGGGRDATPL
jgi:hypothetical protein